MNTAIYYFSGTGNSFVVARDLAIKLSAKKISIRSLIDKQRIEIPDAAIVLVFPDYHSGLPNIVKSFIEKLESIKQKIFYGICTFGGNSPGPTIKYLQIAIEAKGGTLSAGFSIKMPYNYIYPTGKKYPNSVVLKPQSQEEQQQIFKMYQNKLLQIIPFIQMKKSGIFEVSALFLFKIIDLFNLKEWLGKKIWLKMAGYQQKTQLSFAESRKLMDHGFTVTDQCIGCANCAKVCPVGDIKLEDQKPTWLHHCEQCFACLQWCPQSAIQFGKGTINGTHYHHPEVKPQDLYQQ
ncbi:MAG: EFR1 family ferrodoxin [Spirochaetes bacterium]|nr:EFR1 family ferrodoxin [Spirochaetota bacterium]